MYSFIINPNARSGKGLRAWKLIEHRLKEKSVPYQVFFTKYQRHATQIARTLTQEKDCRSLIVLGGDGTLNEAVNGIADLARVTLGYIPIGSSNDFARSLGLEQDPLKALEKILTPSGYVPVNIGSLSWELEHTRRFVVSAGLGFDAGVCHQVAVSRLKVFLNRIGLGKLSYAAVAVGLLLSLTPRRMTLTLDDQTPLEFDRTYFAAIMNHPYEGGGFRFCPKACLLYTSGNDIALHEQVSLPDVNAFLIDTVAVPVIPEVGAHQHIRQGQDHQHKRNDLPQEEILWEKPQQVYHTDHQQDHHAGHNSRRIHTIKRPF